MIGFQYLLICLFTFFLGLAVSGTSNKNAKDGNVEKLLISEDEVFSDVVADFPDCGQNQCQLSRLWTKSMS